MNFYRVKIKISDLRFEKIIRESCFFDSYKKKKKPNVNPGPVH